MSRTPGDQLKFNAAGLHAIMGFGGAAFIASPLSVWLMTQFSTPTHVGVAETFIVLGVIYFW
jgi:hypothetical protein